MAPERRNAVGHFQRLRFSCIVLRGEPIAQALREARGGAIGIGDDEGLIGLIAVDGGGQQIHGGVIPAGSAMVVLLTASDVPAAPRVNVEPVQLSEVPSKSRQVGIPSPSKPPLGTADPVVAMPVTLSTAERSTLIGVVPPELIV